MKIDQKNLVDVVRTFLSEGRGEPIGLEATLGVLKQAIESDSKQGKIVIIRPDGTVIVID